MPRGQSTEPTTSHSPRWRPGENVWMWHVDWSYNMLIHFYRFMMVYESRKVASHHRGAANAEPTSVGKSHKAAIRAQFVCLCQIYQTIIDWIFEPSGCLEPFCAVYACFITVWSQSLAAICNTCWSSHSTKHLVKACRHKRNSNQSRLLLLQILAKAMPSLSCDSICWLKLAEVGSTNQFERVGLQCVQRSRSTALLKQSATPYCSNLFKHSERKRLFLCRCFLLLATKAPWSSGNWFAKQLSLLKSLYREHHVQQDSVSPRSDSQVAWLLCLQRLSLKAALVGLQ